MIYQQICPRNYMLYRNGNFSEGTDSSKVIAGAKINTRLVPYKTSQVSLYVCNSQLAVFLVLGGGITCEMGAL